MTSCEAPDIIDRDGFCSQANEIIPGCSVIEETQWI